MFLFPLVVLLVPHTIKSLPTTIAIFSLSSRSTLATSPPWTTSWREVEWAWEWGGKEGHSMSAEAPYPWTAPRPRPPSAHPWPCRQQEEEGRHQAWEGLLLRNEIVIYTHPGWIFLTFRIFMCLFPEQLIYLRELLHFSRIKRTVPKIFYQKDKYITHAQVLKELGVHFKCRYEPISFFCLGKTSTRSPIWQPEKPVLSVLLYPLFKESERKGGCSMFPFSSNPPKTFSFFPTVCRASSHALLQDDVELCVHSLLPACPLYPSHLTDARKERPY